jgi:hypothetical protein
MFVTLWEYEVKPSCEERFEKVYGPDDQLFQDPLARGVPNHIWMKPSGARSG